MLGIPAIEDLIVDRAAQYESGAAPEMQEQVRSLLEFSPDLDEADLERRLAEETAGRVTVRQLRDLAKARKT